MKTSNQPAGKHARRKLRRDLKTLVLFTAVYCDRHHSGTKQPLEMAELTVCGADWKRHRYCSACRTLLLYAIDRHLRCPLDPKPACRACPHNCYASAQRVAMRRIMAFAGPALIRRGRLDLLWQLYFG